MIIVLQLTQLAIHPRKENQQEDMVVFGSSQRVHENRDYQQRLVCPPLPTIVGECWYTDKIAYRTWEGFMWLANAVRCSAVCNQCAITWFGQGFHLL